MCVMVLYCPVVSFVGQRFHEIRFDISCDIYESAQMSVRENARGDRRISIITLNKYFSICTKPFVLKGVAPSVRFRTDSTSMGGGTGLPDHIFDDRVDDTIFSKVKSKEMIDDPK